MAVYLVRDTNGSTFEIGSSVINSEILNYIARQEKTPEKFILSEFRIDQVFCLSEISPVHHGKYLDQSSSVVNNRKVDGLLRDVLII